MVPVFLCNPFVALFLMSALRPLPQAFVYLIVNPAEHLGGHDISLVIHPAPDNGIELAYQRFLFGGFIALYDAPHLFQERLDRSFGRLDE